MLTLSWLLDYFFLMAFRKDDLNPRRLEIKVSKFQDIYPSQKVIFQFHLYIYYS